MTIFALLMAVIGIMDSGSGGLSVFREIRRALPRSRYIYFSDNAWCPYGDKTADFIRQRSSVITRELLAKGADAIVIACNTATAAAIASLRETFPIPFIGMEPAVKPAALGTRSGVVGVLATAGTLSASKYLITKGLYGSGVRIVEHTGSGFVELVENGVLDGPEAEKICAASLLPLLEAGADTIVLGCTHYPFLLGTLQKVAAAQGYPDIRFIDPAPAVARRLVTVLQETGIPAEDEHPGTELLSSGPDKTLKALYALINKEDTAPSDA